LLKNKKSFLKKEKKEFNPSLEFGKKKKKLRKKEEKGRENNYYVVIERREVKSEGKR